MALTSTDVTDLQGYSVIKLEESKLDRESAYGTLATSDGSGGYTATPVVMPARVWAAGATLTITDPTGVAAAPMDLSAEINATGAVVYGYNWTPTMAGTYQLEFAVPGSVTITNPSATTIDVKVTGGGGSGGGSGGGGRGHTH